MNQYLNALLYLWIFFVHDDHMPDVIAYFAAGVVLRAFLNGTEAAVKRPKIKVTLNPRDLKKFTQEVTTMIKASDLLPPAPPPEGQLSFLSCRVLTACAGEPSTLRANIQRELESIRPLHRHGVDGGRQLVRRAGRGPPPACIPAHQGSARDRERPRLPSPCVDWNHPRRHQESQCSARARRQLQGAQRHQRCTFIANYMIALCYC